MTTFNFSMPETQSVLSTSNVDSKNSNLNSNLKNQDLKSNVSDTVDIIKNRYKDTNKQAEEDVKADKIKNNILPQQKLVIKDIIEETSNNRLIVISLIGFIIFTIVSLLLWYKIKSNQPLY